MKPIPVPPLARGALLLAATGLLLAACASTPPPSAEMAVAEAAIARANSSGIGSDAAAATALRNATMKLTQAQAALAAKDHPAARRLAEQAAIDAQLAEQQAQALRSRKVAQESGDAARALRAELDRKAPL